MINEDNSIESLATQEYKYGFETEIETESFPKGLNENIIRRLSEIKGEPEWMLAWRLNAYKHWLTMTEPTWANITYPKIDYNDIIYFWDGTKTWTHLNFDGLKLRINKRMLSSDEYLLPYSEFFNNFPDPKSWNFLPIQCLIELKREM